MFLMSEPDRSASPGDLVINPLQEFGQPNWHQLHFRLEAENAHTWRGDHFIRLNAAYFDNIGVGVPAQIKLNEGSNLAGNVTEVVV